MSLLPFIFTEYKPSSSEEEEEEKTKKKNCLHCLWATIPLWLRTITNQDVSTVPLARPFASSARLPSLVHSAAFIHLLACSFTQSQARGNVYDLFVGWGETGQSCHLPPQTRSRRRIHSLIATPLLFISSIFCECKHQYLIKQTFASKCFATLFYFIIIIITSIIKIED